MIKTIFSLLFLLSSLGLTAQSEEDAITKGKELINKNACTACHKEYGPNLAPGFSGIGIIYKKADLEKAQIGIAESIAKGSQAKYSYFKDAIMPPYAHLSLDDRNAIAAYILSLTKNYQIK
ncbi:MAG: c-type cytochrome [Bacteroidales bacterium]|nr:c-type cytochrome [Bacteroidales bacterium]